MRSKILLTVLLATCVFMVMLPSCGPVDTAVTAINSAITTLDTQSSQWQQVLQDLEAKLTKDAQSTVATEVSNLLDASIANVGGEFRCNVDFIGNRVKGALQNIVNKLQGKPPTALDPHLCTVVPNAIDLNLVQQGRLNIIQFAGYDLSPAGVKFFSSGQSGEQQIPSSYIANPAPYTMTFNVAASNGFTFPSGTAKVVVRVNGAFFSDMNVIAAAGPPPPPKTGFQDFSFSYHQPGGNIVSQCSNVDSDPASTYTVSAGWKIDRSKGDSSHAGISQLEVHDNQQSINTLTGYNYYAKDDLHLQIEGQICSAGGWGAGAIFDRVYRAFLIQDTH